MFLKITVFNLEEKERSYLMKQYTDRGLCPVERGRDVIVEANATYETCMVYMAMAQYFPDREIQAKQSNCEVILRSGSQ